MPASYRTLNFSPTSIAFGSLLWQFYTNRLRVIAVVTGRWRKDIAVTVATSTTPANMIVVATTVDMIAAASAAATAAMVVVVDNTRSLQCYLTQRRDFIFQLLDIKTMPFGHIAKMVHSILFMFSHLTSLVLSTREVAAEFFVFAFKLMIRTRIAMVALLAGRHLHTTYTNSMDTCSAMRVSFRDRSNPFTFRVIFASYRKCFDYPIDGMVSRKALIARNSYPLSTLDTRTHALIYMFHYTSITK